MANNDHVARLKTNAKDWNDWLEKHLEETPDLTGADLREADLQGANLSGAKLVRAILVEAKLERADFTDADMRHANIVCADLQNAVLVGANLRNANLFGAKLGGANLLAANLDGADLQTANGLILDGTSVRDTRFGVDAQDPWSILRRKYSGPRLAFNLIFLVAFLVPYLVKVLFWASINRVQTYAELVFAERANALGLDSIILSNLSRCLAENCDSRSVLQLILGFDRGSLFGILAVTLITYNALKFMLTWKIASLREEEERTGYSPAWTGPKWWHGYRALYWTHRYFVRWVFGGAVIALVYNACDWLTRTVWIPG